NEFDDYSYALLDELSASALVDLHRRVRLDHRVVEEGCGIGTGDAHLAHMGEVEDACCLAHGAVLGQFRTVLQRHVPSAEVGERGAELDMFGVQRGLLGPSGVGLRVLSHHLSSSSNSSKASGGGHEHTRLRSP